MIDYQTRSVIILIITFIVSLSIQGAPIDCVVGVCSGVWNTYGSNVTLPCDVASGHFPIGFELPMFYEGNYDMCITFPDAHFCTIASTKPIIVPLFEDGKLTGGFPLGLFKYDQCVKTACSSVDIRSTFNNVTKSLVNEIVKFANIPAHDSKLIKNLTNLVIDSMDVSCVEKLGHYREGGVAALVFIGICICLVVIATYITAYFKGNPVANATPLVKWFSAQHNFSRLIATIPGDFNIFNGIRFFSMSWVILGHTFLTYIAPVVNPNAEGRATRGWAFAFVKSAEYAVDTFFFMSAFLASAGVLKELQKRRLSGLSYAMIMITRYLRLTPTYLLVVLIFWQVLPYYSNGPNWHSVWVTYAPQAQCDVSFWSNMLYINNLVPWEKSGAMNSCAGWTWYLANDFQFFLLVPILCQIFLDAHYKSTNKSFCSWFFKYGICITIIIAQIIITAMILAYDVKSSQGTQYDVKIYTKPYTRITPYMVGLMLSFYHFERVEAAAQEAKSLPSEPEVPLWKYFELPTSFVQAGLVGLISMIFTLCGVVYYQFKCENTEHECDVWYGLYMYGYMKSGNWGNTGVAIYYSCCYILWSCLLAGFCYILMAHDKYDLFSLRYFLSLPWFTPIARLTYNAYLVHLPIMLYTGGIHRPTRSWVTWDIIIQSIAYIVMAYFMSFMLYMVVEKPVMNIVTTMMSHLSRKPRPPQLDVSDRRHSVADPDARLPLDTEYSTVADPDNESLCLVSPHLGNGMVMNGGLFNNESQYLRLEDENSSA